MYLISVSNLHEIWGFGHRQATVNQIQMDLFGIVLNITSEHKCDEIQEEILQTIDASYRRSELQLI